MTEKHLPSVSPEKCTGCGLCVSACPTDVLELRDGKAQPRIDGVSPDGEAAPCLCIHCGHCQAVCPVVAVSGATLAPPCSSFETFVADDRYLLPGGTEGGNGGRGAELVTLVRLMASRRSVRRFSEKPVDAMLLRDLVRIGVTAPSATNAQSWTFTILPDRDSVKALSQRVGDWYRRLCRLSSWKSIRVVLRQLGKPELDDFHRGYRSFILKSLDEWENGGPDPFFRGAPAAILIGARPGVSMHGADDAHMAAQNMLLAAHAMGLGTCLIGLALAAFRNDSSILTSLDLPAGEIVHSAIAVGFPAEAFLRLTGRAEPEIRIRSLSPEIQ